nr:hypothetical protein [uncultured Cohaesibacter sp.]
MSKHSRLPPKIAPARRSKKDRETGIDRLEEILSKGKGVGTGLSRLELILDELQIVFSLLFVLAFVVLLLTGIACCAVFIWKVL